MTIDYIVASLPALTFDAPPAISVEKFAELAPGFAALAGPGGLGGAEATCRPAVQWRDLDAQLRNAVATCRAGGGKWTRPVAGCSIYWKNRIVACFQEKDVAKRDEMLDRVWWDAAGELTPPSSPLGEGALATYAVRLGIAAKRAKISRETGNAAFDRLTAETKMDFA